MLSRKEGSLTLGGEEGFEDVARGRGGSTPVFSRGFDQLWSYEREVGRGASSRIGAPASVAAASAVWKFAEMIDRHWDEIAAYCRLENKVSLSFVEGLNNKIRVIQRRAYGGNEEYLRLRFSPACYRRCGGAAAGFSPSCFVWTCINHVSASHRYGHDGQRKRVAHMPTATTTEAASRFTIGLKITHTTSR